MPRWGRPSMRCRGARIPRRVGVSCPARRVAPEDARGRPMATADLVLEGGGVKGIGLVGAISVLEEHGYEFHRIAGTSAGAIVGALVAAGIPIADLQTTIWEVDYIKFQDAATFSRFGPLGK